jgi:hypothetical protein
MTTAPAAEEGWRAGLARRLERLAGRLDAVPGGPGRAVEPVTVDEVLPAPATAASPEADELRTVVEELYPTVAPRVLALVEQGHDAGVDEWVTVARLLYDAHMHRAGGPSGEARQRALVATMSAAIEAQARSSARLAGNAEAALDRPSDVEGDPAGTLLWEHYLCPAARLARSAVHGEVVGDWLGALGELWSASNELHDVVAAHADNDDDDDEEVEAGRRDELTAALDRTKVALVRVEELSLW